MHTLKHTKWAIFLAWRQHSLYIFALPSFPLAYRFIIP